MHTIRFPHDFARPDDQRASTELVISIAILLAGLAVPALFPGSLLSFVAGTIFIAVGILRLYSIQHDCGHYSYFSHRPLNTWVGNGISVFSGIAHSVLRHNHNLHHAHLSDLRHRDVHEIFVMTAQEYSNASTAKKIYYRIYRHPLTLFLLGPFIIYFIRYRWPRNTKDVSVLDVLLQNIAMFSFWGAIVLFLGWWPFFSLMAASFLAGSLGIFTVYVGHNFEHTHWERPDRLNIRTAALSGASSLRLGKWFDFTLLNFGFHDLHHYNTRIPCYHLKACNDAIGSGWNQATLGPCEAIASLKWRLWDEERRIMIPFQTTFLQDVFSGNGRFALKP
ncbi:fatty acid desaturase [Marimonas sp. MJW-29]|uniref:Fatty acid desaturase n=1 Tax=Sulfitobacter sediminis TaxID=3234186 RepID=A0ABV3RUF0_9RHOB